MREDVPSQQCRSWRHFQGGNLKRAFAKFCVDYAGPLITKITQRLSAKKISVPYYLLSKQSGTDFLNASSRMVATRGAEEDRTKSHVIMTQTSQERRESLENFLKQRDQV